MLRQLLGLVTAAVLLASCTRVRPVTAPERPAAFPHHTALQVRSELSSGLDSLRSFEGRGSLVVRSPEESGQFSMRIRNRRNDSLYVSFIPALGIEAARALVTPDSFFVYDRIQRNLYFGSIEHAASRFAALPTADELFLNLLGLITPDHRVPWRLSSDSTYYYLTDDGERHTFTIDPGFWRVVRYEERLEDGTLLEERRFSDFDRFGEQFLPRRVIFRRPEEQALFSLYYRDLTVNPPALSFDLGIRESANRVRVGE